ncbi:MAG: alpha/beta hydrolase [Sphingomicrobium sp.]
MKNLIIAAALAAIATPLSCVSPAAAATILAPTTEHDHIRMTLHGTKGPVVVLIPGMSTPGKVWDDMASSLSGDHRVVVVEVKGFDGQRAPANEAPGLIDGIVADLAADLHARGFHQPVMAGHSFGGLVAMKYALVQPAMVKSIVVVDALPFFGTVFADDATVESIAPRAKAMHDMMVGQADVIRASVAKPTAKDPGGNYSIDPARRIAIANWAMQSDPVVVARALVEDMAMDLRKDIAAIRVPMTILYQAHEDPALAAKRYETDYAAKADTKLVPIKETGHFIQLDQPEAVRTALVAAAR